MNKILLFTFSILFSFHLTAQVGGTAHDFTVTDLDGNEISLYADILDQGLVAIVDVSATWCPPCWTIHSSHVLEELHEKFGPDGSNQLRVIFYEADADTTMEDLLGNTTASMGNWLEGTTYPVINESPLTIDLNIYAPLGFPTINVIRPNDKMIVADPWNVTDFDQMLSAVNTALGEGYTLEEAVSNTLDINSNTSISAFPNPTSADVTLSLEGFDNNTTIEIFTILGKRLATTPANGNETILDFTNYDAGTYMVKATSGDLQQTTQVNVVK